jgi:hypothetical protein
MTRFRILRIAACALIGAVIASDAQAIGKGCGTYYTRNNTSYWIWVTMYDFGKATHMDWGWVAPNTTRRWTGGGSPYPGFNSYMCNWDYYARAEVKASGPHDTPNIFDTTMEVSPAADKQQGDVACLVTKDGGKHFYWIDDATCTVKGVANASGEISSVVAVKSAAPDLKPTPHPEPAVVKLAAADVQAPFGPNSAVHRIDIVSDGKTQPTDLGKLGKWSTSTPDVIQLADDTGGFRVLKAGTGAVTWTHAGKTYEAVIHAQ